MRKICLIIVCGLVATFFVHGDDMASRWVEKDWKNASVTIKVKLERKSFAITEPINMYISANNQSLFPVSLFLTGNALNDFNIHLYKKENRQPVLFSEMGKKIKAETVISFHFEEIAKDKPFQQKIDIGKLFIFEHDTAYLMSIEGNITIGSAQKKYQINDILLQTAKEKSKLPFTSAE